MPTYLLRLRCKVVSPRKQGRVVIGHRYWTSIVVFLRSDADDGASACFASPSSASGPRGIRSFGRVFSRRWTVESIRTHLPTLSSSQRDGAQGGVRISRFPLRLLPIPQSSQVRGLSETFSLNPSFENILMEYKM